MEPTESISPRPVSPDLTTLRGMAILPGIFATLYGIVILTTSRFSVARWMDSYAMVVGGILVIIGINVQPLFRERPVGRGFGNAGVVFFGGIATYAFFIYLIVWEGGARLYKLFENFSVLGCVAGLFWIIFGYRGVRTLSVISELQLRMPDVNANHQDHL